MFGWEIGRWVVAGAALVILVTFSVGVVQYRRLSLRLKRLEEAEPDRGTTLSKSPPAPRSSLPAAPRAYVRPPMVHSPSISLHSCADAKAPAELLSYGLNAPCYTPIIDRREPWSHLIVVVTRIRNNSPREIILRRPQLAFNLGSDVRKTESPAPLVLLSRLNLVDGNGDPHTLDRARDLLLDRLFGERSLNRTLLPIKPRETLVTYTAFLPRNLASLPVFEEDILRFGFILTAGDVPIVFNDIHARRTPQLSALIA